MWRIVTPTVRIIDCVASATTVPQLSADIRADDRPMSWFFVDCGAIGR